MSGWTTPKTFEDDKVLPHTDLNVMRDNFNFLKANQALGTEVELIIDTGAITKTQSWHSLETESEDPSDDLDTINGGSDGDVLYLHANHADREVTLKNETGNLHIGGDIILDDAHKVVVLIYDGTHSEWHNIGSYSQERIFVVNAGATPAPGTDWTPSLLGATLAQNKTGKKMWIPLSIFKIGDQVCSYKLIGDCTEGTALTIDCKLVRITLADPITTSDVAGGAIVQITANGNFSAEAVLTAPEVISADNQCTLEILATTAGSDTIVIMGAELCIVRLR